MAHDPLTQVYAAARKGDNETLRELLKTATAASVNWMYSVCFCCISHLINKFSSPFYYSLL